MHGSIRVALATALALVLFPQVAFGLVKPQFGYHPDAPPVDSRPIPVDGDLAIDPTETGAPLGTLPFSGGGQSGSNAISFASLTDGDIVVVLDPSSVTGHAGMFDRSHYSGILSYAMLSSNLSPANGVQYEKCSKYRLNEWAFALRVPTEYAHRVAVRDYAARFLGRPYSVFGSKTDLRTFYCSKVPWVAYHTVTGADLDGDGGFWVWPVDLISSAKTTLIGYWS